MPAPLKLILPTVAVSLLLAACGSSSSSTTTTTSNAPAAQNTSSAALVKTGSSSLGTILVNGSGMTLYHLSAEKNGKFICTASACTAVWHPVTVSAGTAPSGQVSSLGVVKRPDGTTQVTYKGEPLYTFASDQKPGETKGQGFKDVGTWTVVTTSGAAPASSSAPASTSTQSESSSGGGGGGAYGY
jgi:predicted lipoprotein with Yx(FWY)xxD motif